LTPAQIKLKRTDAILLELIPEAISQLNDERVREVDVVEVRCSRGRSDAKVYLDPHSYSDEEKLALLKLLKKVRPIIEDHCLKDQGWFRSPKLTFEFDEHLKKSQTIEALFKQISRGKIDDS